MSNVQSENGLVTKILPGEEGEPTHECLAKNLRRRPLAGVRRHKHSGPHGAGKSRNQLDKFTGKIKKFVKEDIDFE